MLWRAHLQNVISYETVPVERGSVQSKVTATGTLNAVVDVLVSSQVSGNIKALYADWNSKVKKGQLVALIDPELFQAQVDQASATYRAAHSATLTAQAQREKTKSDLSAAVANEKNAEAIAAKDLANESNARVQWERAQQLFRAQVIAQQDYDTAKASYEAAVAQVSADRALIEAGKQNILSAQASVQVAQSQLESARAQEHQTQAALHQAEVNLDHTKIIAPVDGTVVARRMDVGQTVASTLNPPTIFEIAQDLTKMQVDTNVNESDVGNIAVGQKASFFVDAYPGATFQGVVADVRKAPIVAQNVVTYDVVIAVDNSSLKLFPGMTANVSILAARVDDTLKVPNSVLRFRPSADVLKRNGLLAPRPDQQQIYVLSGGKLQAAPVRFGISDGKYTAIVSGQVQAGAPVVIRAASSGSRASTTPMPPMGPRM
jgi:HlyD family secretion protein